MIIKQAHHGTPGWSSPASTIMHSFVGMRLHDGRMPPAVCYLAQTKPGNIPQKEVLHLFRWFAHTQTQAHTHTNPHTVYKNFYTQKLLHRNFYTQKLLDTEAFTHRCFYTQTLLHAEAFTQKLLHRETFTYRSFCTQQTFTRDAFTNRNF